MNLHSLAEILSTVTIQGDTAVAQLPEDWTQGRSIFGGLLAAVAVRAARSVVDKERVLRSMLVNYIGPVSPGEVELSIENLRAGRSATQLDIRLLQNNQVACSVQLCLGEERESAVLVTAEPLTKTTQPDDAFKFPFLAGLTPNFTQHFDYRITTGQMPFSKSKSNELDGFFSLGNSSDVSVEELAVALGDAWPPTALQKIPKVAMASTLTWSFNFTSALAQAEKSGWWFYRSQLLSAAGGYTQHNAQIYSPNNDLVATSHQSVAIFG